MIETILVYKELNECNNFSFSWFAEKTNVDPSNFLVLLKVCTRTRNLKKKRKRLQERGCSISGSFLKKTLFFSC